MVSIPTDPKASGDLSGYQVYLDSGGKPVVVAGSAERSQTITSPPNAPDA